MVTWSVRAYIYHAHLSQLSLLDYFSRRGLCNSTSWRVLCMPLVGQNDIFWYFYVFSNFFCEERKTCKKAKIHKRVSTSVELLLLNTGRLLGEASCVQQKILKGHLLWKDMLIKFLLCGAWAMKQLVQTELFVSEKMQCCPTLHVRQICSSFANLEYWKLKICHTKVYFSQVSIRRVTNL